MNIVHIMHELKSQRTLITAGKIYLFLILTIGTIDSAIACAPCIVEAPKFYETLNEHLDITSKLISNSSIGKNGYYIASEKQIEENIALIRRLKDGHIFYFSSSAKQRSIFKKCSFSMIYDEVNDLEKELSVMIFCTKNGCDKKSSQDIAGIILNTLKANTTTCKLELKNKTQ